MDRRPTREATAPPRHRRQQPGRRMPQDGVAVRLITFEWATPHGIQPVIFIDRRPRPGKES